MRSGARRGCRGCAGCWRSSEEHQEACRAPRTALNQFAHDFCDPSEEAAFRVRGSRWGRVQAAEGQRWAGQAMGTCWAVFAASVSAVSRLRLWLSGTPRCGAEPKMGITHLTPITVPVMPRGVRMMSLTCRDKVMRRLSVQVDPDGAQATRQAIVCSCARTHHADPRAMRCPCRAVPVPCGARAHLEAEWRQVLVSCVVGGPLLLLLGAHRDKRELGRWDPQDVRTPRRPAWRARARQDSRAALTPPPAFLGAMALPRGRGAACADGSSSAPLLLKTP